MKKVLVSIIAFVLVLQILLPQHRINTAYAMDDVDQFYYELLNEKILYNGIYEYNSDNYREHGVVYTKFFDLNNNGIDDLYILTLEKGLYDSPYGNYVEEIYFDGQLIDSIESSGPGSGLVGDNSITVYISDEELLFRGESSYATGDGSPGIMAKGLDHIYFTSYKDRNNKTFTSFDSTDSSYYHETMLEAYNEGYNFEKYELDLLLNGVPDENGYLNVSQYTINDQPVTEDEYNKKLKQFNEKEWIELVEGGAGTNAVVYEHSSQTVNEALTRIVSKYKPTNLGEDIRDTLDDAFLESMLFWLNETGDDTFWLGETGDMHKRGYNVEHKLSIGGLLSITQELTEHSSYIQYEWKHKSDEKTQAQYPDGADKRTPAHELDEFLSVVIGQTFDTDLVESLNNGYADVWKRDGYYYFSEFGASGEPYTFPYIHQVFRLSDQTYYVDYSEFVLYQGEEPPSFLEGKLHNTSFVELNQLLKEENQKQGLDEKDSGPYSLYAIMKSTVINGETRWTFLEAGTVGRLFTEEDIKSYAQKEPITQQIRLVETNSNSLTSFIALLNEAIENQRLNDLDYSYLLSSLTAEYQKYVNLNSKANKNTVKPTANELLTLAELAQQSWQQIDDGVNDSFTNGLPQVYRINVSNLQYEKPINVSFDQEWKAFLEQAENNSWISISFDGVTKGVLIQTGELKSLIEQYGQLSLELIYEDSNSNVAVQLYVDDEALTKLPSSLQLLMPSASQGMIVNYNDYVWGGMYNPETSSIMFKPTYPGSYTLASNDIEISGELDLTDEQREKIAYLMSRGLFSQEEQKFDPTRTVSRNEFIKDLVLLFFAIDEQAEANFTDVDQSSPYYLYISSGQQREIVKGFRDGTFGGEQNVTIAQMLSLAGRTLADEKGLSYPDNIDEFLQFIDIHSVDAGMKPEIALAIQYGLFSQGGLLEPNRPITNIEAVEILYKLARLLYDDALYVAVPYENEQDSAFIRFLNDNLIISLISGGVLVLAATGTVLYLHRRKKFENNKISA